MADATTAQADAEPPMALPGEVRLESGDDVAALCEEIGRRRDSEAGDGIYVMTLPSPAFDFASYDPKRARLAVDAEHGFRAQDLSFDLVLFELGGPTPGRASEVDMAVPATEVEAAGLQKLHRAGAVVLSVWFRVARTSGEAPSCAVVHHAEGQGVRLAIEPVAFELRHGAERVASGEAAAFTALREAAAPRVPRVVVAPPVQARTRAPASEPIARVALALEPQLLACYRGGLAEDPTLRGSLVVGIALDGEGRVASARPEIDGLGDGAVTSCVIELVSAARFPRGAGERISVPIKFTAAN